MGVGSIAQRGVRDGRWRPAAAWRTRTAEPSAVIVGVLVLLGGALRFYGLGHQGLWYDEANTDVLVRQPVDLMLNLIPTSESTPPLYYLLAWVWTHVFGTGAAGLRSLSALFGVLLIPVAYAVGRAAATRRIGLVLAALVAFSPMLIWYSQEARSYALLILLTALALLALLRAHRTGEPRAFAGWAVAASLALTTHYYAILALAPMALWMLVQHGRRRAAQVAVAVVTATGAALIPLALAQNSTNHDRWISRHPLSLRLSQILPQVVIGPSAPDRLLLKFIGFAAAAVAMALLARAPRPERRVALGVAALVLVGVAMNFVFILAGYDDLITRNLLALMVPTLLVLAIGLGTRRSGSLGVVATAVLCALGMTAAVGVASERILQRPDWRPLAQVLGPPPASPGRAILIQNYGFVLPLSLYMPGLRRLSPKDGAVVNEFDVISIKAPKKPPVCWWGAACNLVNSHPQSSLALQGFHFAWQRQVRQFTVDHYVSRRRIRIWPRTVAPALTANLIGRDTLIYQR